MNSTKNHPCVWKTHGWKIGYFVAGILFIGLGKHFLPFWLRVSVLAVWAIGLAVLFVQTMDAQKDNE